MKLWVLLFIGVVFSVEASMESAAAEGRAFAESMHAQAKNAALHADVKQVPGFESAHPKEANLDKNGNFADAIHQTLQTEQTASQLIENTKQRPRFKIDLKTDPRFQVDLRAAEQDLGIDSSAPQKPVQSGIEKTCEEGGEEVTYECFENRVVRPQVPLKTTTLWVDHLQFAAHMESYEISGAQKGKWNRHGKPAVNGTRQNGYILTLPKDLKAFKDTFCTKFTGIDAKTKAVFAIDCSSIEGYALNPASGVIHAQDAVSMRLSEAYANISLFHRTYAGEHTDEWQSLCDAMEQMVDEGFCQYGERLVSQGPETRNIEGYAIHKDAWQYKQIYQCKMNKDECTALRLQGCTQKSLGRCKEMRQGSCWIYEQLYQCPSEGQRLEKIKSPPLSAFCLTGDCHSTDYQANGQMLDAMARLTALKEIQKDMRDDHNNLNVFKGAMGQCTRHCLSFKDCCGRLKGWGVSLGLSDCDAEDRALSEKRAQHLCHPVGTYCAEWIKVPPFIKKCVRKKSSFCCFGNRFGRLLQVQGRSQLGLGWGELESPDCRGLSIEELSKLDLSKMDFSELFEDILKKYQAPKGPVLEQKTHESLQERFKQMQQGLEGQTPKTGKLNVNQNAL